MPVRERIGEQLTRKGTTTRRGRRAIERRRIDGRWGRWGTHLLHDTGLALGEGDVSPRLVLNKFNLDFPTTGLLILLSTFFLFVVVAATVDSIVVLDEGVVADGREAVVPGVGTRTLILSRRGCDGIRHVAMEDEKGKSNKRCVCPKKEPWGGGRESRESGGKLAGDGVGVCAAAGAGARRREGRAEERTEGERDEQGDERTMGWRGRAFWNGKLFLVGRRRPSWAKKEQAIYISKQPSPRSHRSYILLWNIPSFFILRPNSCKLFY